MSFGKEENHKTGIRICGVGGMGVILSSVVLGKAAIYDNKIAVQTQSYGAAQRGTKVRSDVIISESGVINYPIIDKADILIAFTQEAFNFFIPNIKLDSKIFINSNNVKCEKITNNLYEIPARDLARELKNDRVLNLIILGALLKITNIVTMKSMIKSITDTVSEPFIEINIQALQKGYEYF